MPTVAQDPAAAPPEPPPAASPRTQPAKPNAALLYRSALKEMQRALADPTTGGFELPEHDPEQPETLIADPWPEVVTKAAVARTLFSQATQILHCEFEVYPAEMMTEVLQLTWQLIPLRHIVLAEAWQQLATAPQAAGTTAMQLLLHANHFRSERNNIGMALHFDSEREALRLLAALIPELAKQADARAIATRFGKHLEQHQARRLSTADIADTLEHHTAWLLEHGLSKQAKDHRAFAAASKRAIAWTREILEPLRKQPELTPEAFQEHFGPHVKALKKLTRGNSVEALLETSSDETLAAALTSLLVCDPSPLLRQRLDNGELLSSCRDQLRKLREQK